MYRTLASIRCFVSRFEIRFNIFVYINSSGDVIQPAPARMRVDGGWRVDLAARDFGAEPRV